MLEIPEAGLGFIGVLAGTIVNGIVMAILGNSLGKAIFGISVYKVGSEGRLSLMDTLGRELRAWVFGLGLGIPIVTLFTTIAQFRKVNSRQSTGYDAGLYLVKQKKVSSGRILLGIVISVLLIAGVSALSVWGNTSSPSVQVAWVNQDSKLQTTISSAWEPSRQTAADGSPSTILLNSDTGEQILVGLETYAGASLQQYTDALSKSLSAEANITAWAPASSNAWTALGKMKTNGIPIDLRVFKIGDRYWRVLGFDMTAKKAGHFMDQAALAAILKTVN
jgi:hypothetical protein